MSSTNSYIGDLFNHWEDYSGEGYSQFSSTLNMIILWLQNEQVWVEVVVPGWIRGTTRANQFSGFLVKEGVD